LFVSLCFVCLFVLLYWYLSLCDGQTMRPIEFAPEAVIQAGQQLRDSGRNITGFALRKIVGGGNPTRLKQVWDEHVSTEGTQKHEPTAELPIEVAEEMASVSTALVERLTGLAVALNDKAVKAAERRVHEVVRAAGEQREQAERELVDASQTVDDLESKLDETLAVVEGVKAELVQSHEKSQRLAVELAQTAERLALGERTAKAAEANHAAEQKRLTDALDAERQRRQEETDKLRTDLATATARAEAAREQHAAELARFTACHDDERAKNENENKRLAAALETEKHRYQHDTENLRTDLAKAATRAEAADEQHKADTARYEQAIEQLKVELRTALAQAESAKGEVATSREETAKLRGQIQALELQTSNQLQTLAAFQNQSSENDTGTKSGKTKPPPKS
jgi:colicin import membrane protein